MSSPTNVPYEEQDMDKPEIEPNDIEDDEAPLDGDVGLDIFDAQEEDEFVKEHEAEIDAHPLG